MSKSKPRPMSAEARYHLDLYRAERAREDNACWVVAGVLYLVINALLLHAVVFGLLVLVWTGWNIHRLIQQHATVAVLLERGAPRRE